MPKFERKINLDLLSDMRLASAPWLVELLRNWHPAGHCAQMVDWTAPKNSKKHSGKRPFGLRLAIRNGYVNFYCGGQSIAKVSLGPRSFKAESHKKYMTDEAVDGQHYVKLGPDDTQVAAWMHRSHGYQGAEKLFVEEVCAANETLIDLEMGLPSLPMPGPDGGIRLVAPRIDLVALEPVSGGWQVAFWEAKLPDDGRLRTTGNVPNVVAQLKNYADWFARPGAREEVLAAYRNNCVHLVKLDKLAAAFGRAMLPLHDAIHAIAKDPTQLRGIDTKVRLLIDRRRDSTNFDSVHLPKLQSAGITVHVVRSDDDLILPPNAATA